MIALVRIVAAVAVLTELRQITQHLERIERATTHVGPDIARELNAVSRRANLTVRGRPSRPGDDTTAGGAA